MYELTQKLPVVRFKMIIVRKVATLVCVLS